MPLGFLCFEAFYCGNNKEQCLLEKRETFEGEKIMKNHNEHKIKNKQKNIVKNI